jgi:hypothetical protein
VDDVPGTTEATQYIPGGGFNRAMAVVRLAWIASTSPGNTEPHDLVIVYGTQRHPVHGSPNCKPAHLAVIVAIQHARRAIDNAMGANSSV